MRFRQRTAVIAAATALLTGGLTGCSLPSEDKTGATPMGKADPKAVDPGKLIVKTTADSTMGKVDIGLASLAVRGRLAHLVVSLTPHVPPGGSSPTLYRLNGTQDAALLDTVNLKRYVVVKDSGGNQLGPGLHDDLNNNAPNTLTFTFAAPPENVKAVDVQVGRFPIFRDVPIER
ncbi:hypothetical protein [Actinomadura rudentiformis]|uniref:hypothetical protein n=1 Tax=Actinomadura rudentiformis TaxID=359158 RepID=UPI00178C1E05|nr:hypothetical protein [Actinomadura rudentiformis]